jgi:hypothetical protein
LPGLALVLIFIKTNAMKKLNQPTVPYPPLKANPLSATHPTLQANQVAGPAQAYGSMLPLNQATPQHADFIDFDNISDAYLSGDAYLLTTAILEPILGKGRTTRFPSLNSRIRLNEFDNLSEPELHYIIGQYQNKYDSISNISITLVDRKQEDRRILIQGRHETGYCFKDHCTIVRGDWHLDLVHHRGAWVVVNIQVEGVDFAQ